jgi:XTP/dITP diphosphohydrolase
LADPQGVVQAESTGRCAGRIRFAPAGSSGFGYDPLFEVVEYHRTFGELSAAVKASLSHRARAIRQLVPRMQAAFAGQAGQLLGDEVERGASMGDRP